MEQIQINDIIEIPAGADRDRRATYRLRVTEVRSGNGYYTWTHGEVVRKDGTTRTNPSGRPFMRTAWIDATLCNLLDRAIGAVDVEASPVTVRVVEDAPAVTVAPRPVVETRTGRYGQPVQVEIRDTDVPGAVVETRLDTGIETARSLPGTHPRGPVGEPFQLDNGATSVSWRRVINGTLYSFIRITIPSGEIRMVVTKHTGYADLRFACAWRRVHLLILPVPAPKSTAENPTIRQHIRQLVETGRDGIRLALAALQLTGADETRLPHGQREMLRAQVQPIVEHPPYVRR